jgi:signal recognition particle receptor subunit beta
MAIYAMLGMIVVAAIFAAGASWVVRNITFKPMNTTKSNSEDKTDERT